MPRNLSEAASSTVELVFPDDATDSVYSLRELSVYGAEEVRNETENEVPKYGDWIPVTDEETERDEWLNLPSDLAVRLDNRDVKPNEPFRIEKLEKDGTGQSAEYVAELSFPERNSPGKQSGLSNATSD